MPSYPDIHPFIAGRSRPSTSSHTFRSVDPSTSLPIATIHSASPADIDAAVTAARSAFPSWSSTPPAARGKILLQAAALLRQHNDELATIETHDTGKPFSETSTVDIVTGADVLEYFANLVAGGGLNGETTQLRDDAWVYTTKAPLGVCAGIGAWNYPIQIALWKSAPCLVAGNCMVYKPSEVTPLHATRLAEIYKEAGLPDGVFNVVHGDGAAVGQHLVSHPGIAKVSFTGQVSTGQKVAASAAGGMKYVTMELGGKSPLLVLPDSPLEDAVDGAMMANFFSTGQVCTNGTRVFVPKSMKPAFEKLLVEKMKNVRMGALMDPQTNFGPLVSEVHARKVAGYIKHGKDVDRARVLYDGRDQSVGSLPESLRKGFWQPAIIFSDCTDDMKIVKEEIFGPVMAILYYDDSGDYLDKLIARANDTELGLAAGVFTKDLNLAHHIIARLEAGITWVNTWGESPAEMSVGGWKKSGVGVENGRRGIEAWVRNKSTLVEMGGKVVTAFEAAVVENRSGSSKL
ncbi:hypothetical protein FH972_022256 [Carpinus fangiana]|uniref:Aldehyde dehydrogenase domain-containing protein n=1 Tax=Carpinus fangiana TaxID=176857 RepID=A0A5N6KS89_9ROSI|nr:hypothetical protein FH972_022256 [Carpinus fangiana]